jgi:hypothetical protein
MARTPEQVRRDGLAASKRYIAHCPVIVCPDCGRSEREYGRCGRCRTCYAYRQRTGHARTRPVSEKRSWRRCWICLDEFWPRHARQGICTSACWHVLQRIRKNQGQRTLTCVGCGRWRLIRAKGLCGGCYVLARLALNHAGIYGACASRLNRFKGVPGVLNAK